MYTWSRLAIFAIVEKNHVMMSMEAEQGLGCRMTLVIPFEPLKDRIIVGPHVILNATSHLAGCITHSDREAK